MKLLTKALRKKLPPLDANEEKSLEETMVVVKFFTPWSFWTWYVTEFDGEDIFFGYVDGFEAELGYFSLSELESTCGPFGLRIERDLYFEPKPLSDIMAAVKERRYGKDAV